MAKVDQQREQIERAVTQALDQYFRRQPVVRFSVARVKAEHRPRDQHRHGWDGFRVTIALRDGTRNPADTMPSLSLDLAAPEALTDTSTQELDVGGVSITVYSEARINAEKLRAYLERLPEHQAKIGADRGGHRVKDLYDIAVVLESHALTDTVFWSNVAHEFAVACASRAVDCDGMRTFEQGLAIAADLYRNDATIPADRSFESVWDALITVVAQLEEHTVIPVRNPLRRSDEMRSEEMRPVSPG